MIINPIWGKGTGKVGALVFQVNGGEQIVKEKPAKVSNPNTDAQVEQRAKLKLMSQLAAALANVIAFKKQGLVSARNQFVSKNIGLCTYTAEGGAVCDLSKIDLTGGKLPLPNLSISDSGANTSVALSDAAPESIKRVLYAAFRVTESQKLSFVDSVLVSVAGSERDFQGNLAITGGEFIVFGYGIADANANVTTKFDDYLADIDEHEAALLVVRSLSVSANLLTVTKYAEQTTD